MHWNQKPALLGLVLCLLSLSSLCLAQTFPDFTEYTWIGGTGPQNWQVGANWDLGDFPNDADPEDTIFTTANLSASLAGNLDVNVGATPVAIAGLTLGGTSGAVTTEISSQAGGQLRFRNEFVSDFSNPDNDADFDNNGSVSGTDFLIWQENFGTTNPNSGTENNYNDHGDADADNDVDQPDLTIWQQQYSFGIDPLSGNNAFLISGGVPGSVNRISAPMHIDDETLRVDARNPLGVVVGANITNSAEDMDSNASFDVVGGVVTVDSEVIVTNVNTAPMSGGIDMRLRATGNNATLILNGVVRDANPALAGNVTFGGGDGRVEIYGDNDLGGTVRTGGEILLGHDHALGVSSAAPNDPATVRPGGTFFSNDDARDIPNNIILQSNFNAAGDKSLTLSGEITQTNNRGFNNNIAAPGMLILSGQLTIWEDDEALVREFDFLGTGTTMITAVIRDDPQNSGNDRRLNQRGPGVLIIDVDQGDNFHTGPTTITNGNFHYADNASLNAGPGLILSRGGAIGVDTGVANNSTFAGKIDSASFGGLMIAPSDAAAHLNFTGTLANAANMTVAAPETGIAFTGIITPANSTYGLGGGAGTLTLPNAQLSGPNSLEVRNGGAVELLGDNSYTGSTSVFNRPSNTVLVVDDLANGGVNSSIGAATSDAENLYLQGGVLRYVGSGDSTDRLFTIGTAGATIESSGTGAVVFSNAGVLGRDDAEERTGDVDDFTPGLAPNQLYNIEDITGTIPAFTQDIVPGMPVSDPDGGGFHFGNCAGAGGENCIPPDTIVTGVSSDGMTLGISNSYPFVQKLNTRLVFGTVERTLTLGGSNADDNTIGSVISDSPMGGVVQVEKTGSGKWILSGDNTYTGDTTVEEGTLGLASSFLADAADVRLDLDATLDLDFSGDDVIDDLFVDGVQLDDGIYGATDGGMGYNVLPQLSGSGFLNVGGVPFQLPAIFAVPEPTSALLAIVMWIGLGIRRPTAARS